MMAVRAIDHLVLRVRDVERSLAFYRDLLGLTVEGLEALRSGEKPFASVRIGDSLLDLVPDPAYEPAEARAGGLLHFCVTLDDLRHTVERLRAAGVSFLHDEPVARGGARGIGPSIYAEDPDGHVIELKEW